MLIGQYSFLVDILTNQKQLGKTPIQQLLCTETIKTINLIFKLITSSIF